MVAMMRVTSVANADPIDELVEDLRHDLNQPLTVLLTLSELLSIRLERAGLADEARNAAKIHAVVQRLGRIVQDRLDTPGPGYHPGTEVDDGRSRSRAAALHAARRSRE
jgi:hypothetical protein